MIIQTLRAFRRTSYLFGGEGPIAAQRPSGPGVCDPACALLCSAWAAKFVLYGGGKFINPFNPIKWLYYHYQSILITLFLSHYSYHAVPERIIPIKLCLSSYSYHAVPTKLFNKIVKFIILFLSTWGVLGGVLSGATPPVKNISKLMF